MDKTIVIKNVSEAAKDYGNVFFTVDFEYTIQDEAERLIFAADSNLRQDILAGLVEVSNGVSTFSPIIGHDWLVLATSPIVSSRRYPFSEKILENGKKLYRRKHGISGTIVAGGSNTISLVIPYNLAKINKVELVNGVVGDHIDLKVYDTPTGTLSTVPNYMLNQFGFGVFVPNGYYEDSSQYDADLIKDMKVEITYHNESAVDHTIYINVILHEVV